MTEHDAEREASVRERLAATVEGYPVHKGCGGEVAYDEELIGTCMACDQRVPDPRAQWSLADDDGRLGCEEYVRDVSVLITQIDELHVRYVLVVGVLNAMRHQRDTAARRAGKYSRGLRVAYVDAVEMLEHALQPEHAQDRSEPDRTSAQDAPMHDADALRKVLGLAESRLEDLGDDALPECVAAFERVREMQAEEQADKERNHGDG